MTNKSRIIFKNAHYTACAMRDGSLVVTKNKPPAGTREGWFLKAPDVGNWIFAIEDAIDANEAAALCRAGFQQ